MKRNENRTDAKRKNVEKSPEYEKTAKKIYAGKRLRKNPCFLFRHNSRWHIRKM